MTEDQKVLAEIRKMVESLPDTQRARVEKLAAQIRLYTKVYGTDGILAVAWVGAELAAEE